MTDRRYDCPECGNWLPDTSDSGRRARADRVYCSDRCRVRANRRAAYVAPAEKTCEACGATFRPLRGKQKVCDLIEQASKECAEAQTVRAQECAQQALDTEDARWETECARNGCGNNAGWDGRGRPRKFCSDRCKTAHYRAVKRQKAA